MSNFDPYNQQKNSPIAIRSRVTPPVAGKSHSIIRKIFAILLVLAVTAGTFFGAILISRAVQLSNKVFVGKKSSFFGKLKSLVQGNNTKLIGEDISQVNILLLGMGGEGHDGPYLTDTIVLAQIRPDIGEITLTHIPRDYLVTLPDNLGDRKINAAFAEGYYRTKDWDKAGSWSRQIVEKISGLKVPYFAVVDFSGFQTAIDKVGGIDVEIERTFTDYQYPDKRHGYLPPVTFKAGPEHMNGERALIFSRSRHAAPPEGSDYARGQRQQKIIDAFKKKIFELNLVNDAKTINELLSVFADHFHTNLSPGEMFRLYNVVKENNMTTATVSLDPETGLVCPLILESNGAFVLTPCQGKSERDIQQFFQNSFALAKITNEDSIVWLATSTEDKAAYRTAYRKLTNAGLTVFELGYSKDNLQETLFHQVNSKPGTAEFLKKSLNAIEATEPPPGVRIQKEKVDIIIILGLNATAEPEPQPYILPPARKPATTTPNTATSTPTSATSTPAAGTTIKSSGLNTSKSSR